MKTGQVIAPFARGGRRTAENPTGFSMPALNLAKLAVDQSSLNFEVLCSEPLVESLVIDHKEGTLLTLVNWSKGAQKNLAVRIRMPEEPGRIWSVSGQTQLVGRYAEGVLTITMDLAEADYVILGKKK
jgi:hypothetical protein